MVPGTSTGLKKTGLMKGQDRYVDSVDSHLGVVNGECKYRLGGKRNMHRRGVTDII